MLLTVVTYGLPFFLLWLWLRKLADSGVRNSMTWRSIALWVGLSACTVAVGAFWLGIFTNPNSYPREDIHFRRFMGFVEFAGALAIGSALVGEGKDRWFVVLSSLAVGASWVWFGLMQ